MKNQNQAQKQGKSTSLARQSKKQTIMVPMSRAEIAALDQGCKKLNVTRDEFIELAVRERIKREEGV